MKQASLVATVILAAAVLLAAYAIGRLIRQTPLEEAPPAPQEAAEPNDVNQPDPVMMSGRVSQKRRESTPEERARIKQTQAEKLEQMSNLTEEEEAQLREDLRRQLRTRDGEPGQVPQLSPEELEELSRRWPTMSDEERAAFRAKMRGRRPRAVRPVNPAPTAQPVSETQAAEPNAAVLK